MTVMQSGALAALAQGEAEVSMEPGCWTVVNTPATGVAASASRAAGGQGVRHFCRGIFVAIAANATAQGPIRIVLRDGPTGTGNILFSTTLSAIANGCNAIYISPITIVGSPNTAMTLESTTAPATGVQCDVTLMGVTLQN